MFQRQCDIISHSTDSPAVNVFNPWAALKRLQALKRREGVYIKLSKNVSCPVSFRITCKELVNSTVLRINPPHGAEKDRIRLCFKSFTDSQMAAQPVNLVGASGLRVSSQVDRYLSKKMSSCQVYSFMPGVVIELTTSAL